MFIVFDADRPSDSPFVERVWRCRSEAGGRFLSVASSLQATGMTYGTLRQIERARPATSLLRRGVSQVQSGRAIERDRMYWIGAAMSGLMVLFLLMDSVMKLLAMPIVLETGAPLGFVGADMARLLGVVLIACTILYVIPATSVLGAILLTGYLGGAVATHVRVGDPLFSHDLFGVYIGVLLWGGLYLRDARLRALLPLRN